jgi:alpha-glucoside transport system permease protein
MTSVTDRVPRSTPAPSAEPSGDRTRREIRVVGLLFLTPALIVLAILVAWPIVQTIWSSFHDANGLHWVGWHNYATMFSDPSTRKAITNNIIWVIVAPMLVTFIGLILAVLTERIRFATAFKTVLFVPMAISFLAAGVTWRLVYDASPQRGVLNAFVVEVHDTFAPASHFPGARPRDDKLLVAAPGASGAFQSRGTAGAGTVTMMPLVGVPAAALPSNAKPAAAPAPGSGVNGVVWLDFSKGGGGTAGAIDPNELGLPGVTVQAVQDGHVVASATTSDSGAFTFPDLRGSYQLRLPASNFTAPYNGVNWLGPTFVTPAIIVSYLWIWAGFAMVLVGAGLAALDRETLEAARVDGASEWQVFRRITMPLVRPVLIVVLVTLVINVLKIFDLIFVISPSESLPNSTVVAVQMYQVAFGGGQDAGLGSALGVLLFILVIPAMIFNVRRLRRERS